MRMAYTSDISWLLRDRIQVQPAQEAAMSSASSVSLTRKVLLSALAALVLVASGLATAHAQSNYPTRPVRIIVGFAAGGGNDIFARIVAAKLSDIVGQAVIVENRPGAGGRLAAEYVSHQLADGYTLLVGASGAMSIAPAIYPDSNTIQPRLSCRSP